MPIVKQSWVKTPEALEKYLEKDRDAEMVKTASNGLAEEMAKTIRAEHEAHRKNVKNLALTIIQSWSEKESNLFPPEKYNEMGQELARRIAPGHLAWVVTHTEKSHIHNHIVICSVNSETGKYLVNKRSELTRLHEANNAIARENGFSVIEPRVKALDAKLSPIVSSMVTRGKKSWIFDLVQKADFSRAVSTSFDEYTATMKGLGVDTRIEEKNISYFYGDHKKAIRGKSLGKHFDKEGLMKAFKENDEKFAKVPGLRERLRSDIGATFDGKGNPLGTPSNLLLESTVHSRLGKKDYSKFTKIDRSKSRDELPAIFDKHGGVLYEEMKKAKAMSLHTYCEKNRILFSKNEKGESVLRGKEFIVLKSPEKWMNTKNGTQGTIIDFVRIHDESTYLHAIAKINGNPRILLLEQVMGEYTRGYQSFYFPKPPSFSRESRSKVLHKFLNAKGIRGEAAGTLLESRNVHVGKDASVWFMGEKGDSALEFREEKDGSWKAKRHGNPAGIFSEVQRNSKRAIVFRDPFDFALFNARGASHAHNDASILVMLGEGGSDRKIDEFLALNAHITEIHLAHTSRTESQESERRIFNDMQKKFNPFDIKVKELKLSDLGKERAHGPDISI